MVFVASLRFDNTRDNPLLSPESPPLTIGHGQHVRAWLTKERYVVLGSGNLAVVEASPGGMLSNEDSRLTVSTPRGSPVAPFPEGIGYPCPEETDLDLSVAGRCVVRVRA